MRFLRIDTPLGDMRIVEDGKHVIRVDLPGTWEELETPNETENFDRKEEESPLLVQVRSQLTEYFRGERQRFDVPLAPHGTLFQREVWAALEKIPYGQTRSYGEVASMVGRPKASRAIGGANHVNPIAIIIPCHRVIGANGSLTGYGGGLAIKAWLLALEQGAR